MPDEPTLPDAENQEPDAQGGGAGGTEPTVKTYSQDEVNRTVKDRLARQTAKHEAAVSLARTDAVSAWREENGITDDTIQKLQGEDKTHADLKRIAKEKAEIEKRHGDLQGRFQLANSKLVDGLTRSAVLGEAAKKSVDPESVYLHLRDRLKVEDDYSVTILGEDGEPAHGSEIADIIDDLLIKKPFLAKPTGDSGGGARPNGSGGRAPQGPDLKTREGRAAALKSADW